MAEMRFSWKPAKAAANMKKHSVSFETAARVFLDPFALTEQDRIEDGERRWQTRWVLSTGTCCFWWLIPFGRKMRAASQSS